MADKLSYKLLVHPISKTIELARQFLKMESRARTCPIISTNYSFVFVTSGVTNKRE